MALRASALLLAACAIMGAASASYRASIEQWRRHREAALTADGGWLTVTGLFWLHEGFNTFGHGSSYDVDLPAEPELKNGGMFELRGGKVTMRMDGQTRTLAPDTSGHPYIVRLGSLTWYVIQRGDRYGIRLKDRNSQLRKEFRGLHYFPIDPSYCIHTRLVPDPQKIRIANVLGQVQDEPSPGYVSFVLHGRKLRLYPVEDSPGELSFIFRDLTSGKETYGAGRFLDVELSKNGQIVLDFNKAYNPPCAFTPYATCPLPPKENRLDVRIEAGELKYGSH